VQPVAPGQVAPWLDGRWIFQATPLAQALAQVNRQHERPVLLQDPSLAELRISGSFRMADREGLLDALLLLYPLAREEGRDRTYLLRRGGAE
jgi:transmembrane sensor